MKIVQMLFPGGKSKAFTMSYDDGVVQDRRLVAMMNQYGIKGTFNLNSGFLGRQERAVIDGIDTEISKIDMSEVTALYREHEVANHGVTHLKLTDVSKEVVTYQIVMDRIRLESITNRLCTGFAYPFGAYDETCIEALKASGIRYARTVENTGEFGLPKSFMKWHPTCHHNDSRLMEYAQNFCEKDALFGSPQLFYLWGHSYEFDQKSNWDTIEEFLKFMGQYHQTVWFATNGEICHYVNAFRKLEYFCDGSKVYNPTSTDLCLSADGETITIHAGETINIK